MAENRCPYNREDVIVVTGGSRGVTAQCLLALMEKAPCKVAILGRAAISEEHMDDEETAQIPDLREMKTLIARRFKASGYKGPFSAIEKKAKAILDQRDMLHTFRTLESIGCTVRYYACDVNNRENLRQTMEQIQSELGPVRGIIHGAGLLADCKIWNKDMARFRAVLGEKYREVDQYPIRARIPLPPFMFASRIISIDAEFGVLRPSSIVSEYDLDEDCVFRVGDTLRTVLKINRFVKNGSTTLLFFTFESYNGDELISVTEATGGFFTRADLESNKGIIRPKIQMRKNVEPREFLHFTDTTKTTYEKPELDAFFRGITRLASVWPPSPPTRSFTICPMVCR